MSRDDFHSLDDTSVEASLTERDYMKIYHQHGSQFNDSNQDIHRFFGENINYHQIGKRYLEIDKTVKINGGNRNNVDGDGNIDEPIRLVIIVSANAFRLASFSTNGREEIEQNNWIGHFSTILRLLAREDGF